MKDKYSAVWVSHSSISDYLKCPRLYFLRNIFRDPKTQHKVVLMQPALALGQVIHDTIDYFSRLPSEIRFKEPLMDVFSTKWNGISGKLGGFMSSDEEKRFRKKGESMIERLEKYPGPLVNKAIKIRQDLPHYWISDEDNIILCGKIDWLEYVPESDSVHIIDFKTGKYDEDPNSLQLPIYYLLTSNCQTKPVSKASYWYLDRDVVPLEVELPSYEDAEKKVKEIAKKIALARKLEHLPCPRKEGCRFCLPYEQIIKGNAEHVGINEFSQDIYIMKKETPS